MNITSIPEVTLDLNAYERFMKMDVWEIIFRDTRKTKT